MRVSAKILKLLGVLIVFIGLGAMDADLIIIPISMMITGGAIAFAGLSIEGSMDGTRASR